MHWRRNQLDQWRHDAVNASTKQLSVIILIHTREMCVCCDRPRLKLRGTQDKRVGCGTAVVHLGFDASSSDFPTLSMNICASQPFFFSLSSPSFPWVSHLPSCVTCSRRSVHLPFSSVSVSLWLSAWLTQGTTPTPNTAELKQTHFARVKINHFLFSLSLPLSLS